MPAPPHAGVRGARKLPHCNMGRTQAANHCGHAATQRNNTPRARGSAGYHAAEEQRRGNHVDKRAPPTGDDERQRAPGAEQLASSHHAAYVGPCMMPRSDMDWNLTADQDRPTARYNNEREGQCKMPAPQRRPGRPTYAGAWQHATVAGLHLRLAHHAKGNGQACEWAGAPPRATTSPWESKCRCAMVWTVATGLVDQQRSQWDRRRGPMTSRS